MTNDETYLGDGVYATHDGYGITLDLRGQDNYTRIYLEPEVLASLIKFNERVREELREEHIAGAELAATGE